MFYGLTDVLMIPLATFSLFGRDRDLYLVCILFKELFLVGLSLLLDDLASNKFIVIVLLYRQGTKYYYFLTGFTGEGFYMLLFLDLSFYQKTVKLIFFFDFVGVGLSYCLNPQIKLYLRCLLQSNDCLLGAGKTYEIMGDFFYCFYLSQSIVQNQVTIVLFFLWWLVIFTFLYASGDCPFQFAFFFRDVTNSFSLLTLGVVCIQVFM